MNFSYRPSADAIRDHLVHVQETAHLPNWQRSDFSLQLLLGLRDREVDDALRQVAPLLNPDGGNERSFTGQLFTELLDDLSIYRIIRLVTRATSALSLAWLTPTRDEVAIMVLELGEFIRAQRPRCGALSVTFASLCDIVARFGDRSLLSSLRSLGPANWLERTALDSACGVELTLPELIGQTIPAWLPTVPPALIRDPLTGLLNRAVLSDDLHRYRLRPTADLVHLPASGAILLDVDHMKRILDIYGMRSGDEVLKAIAGHFQTLFGDRVVRFGGDELLILWEGDGLAAVAERAVSSVATLPVPDFEDPKALISVTVSAGVASGSELRSVIFAAEDALKRAKQSGRNRVEMG